jgi:hypothetical protein
MIIPPIIAFIPLVSTRFVGLVPQRSVSMLIGNSHGNEVPPEEEGRKPLPAPQSPSGLLMLAEQFP